MSIENPEIYNSSPNGIRFSKIETGYDNISFFNDFKKYAVAEYPTYLEDKQKFDAFQTTNELLSSGEAKFMREFSSKEMALKIKFFGQMHRKLDETIFPRAKFSKESLGALISVESKKELNGRINMLQAKYMELRNSGKTHEEITK